MAGQIKYSDAQIEKLLEGIHDGSITDRDLPENLYYAIADYLKKGLYEGFGGDLTDVEGTKLENLVELRENIYLFSAAKTFNFVKDAADLLTDEDGKIKPFSTFKNEALGLYGQYNENWLQAEYATTIGQAQMAVKWQDIESSKDILPMLRFSTNGHACPECDPFNNLTAPVGHPVWRIASPLLHFRCMCILEQLDSSYAGSSEKHINGLPWDNIPPMFRNNPGQTGEIFNKDHPYFDVPKEDRKFAKKNFGLDIPKED